MPGPKVPCRIVQADLDNLGHQAIVLSMVRAYAQDPMGTGEDLAEGVQQVLIERLRQHPTVLVFIAFQENQPLGVAICFGGFSTFRAQPLINIHDLYVAKEHRGKGVGRQLLQAVEEQARVMGCCKLTLEVQKNNTTALSLYHGYGFEEGQYESGAGIVLFRQKKL